MSTQYPILILRSCFHVGVLNSRAMELLGLNRDTVAKYGEFAEVDERGEPNGVVKENVVDDIKAALPSVGLAALLERVVEAQRDLFAVGLTSIQSDDFKYAPEEKPYALMDGLRALAESGRLKLRMAEQALLTEPETLDEFFDRGMADYGASHRFRISTVKILADGSLGARTAFLRGPYTDAPETPRSFAVRMAAWSSPPTGTICPPPSMPSATGPPRWCCAPLRGPGGKCHGCTPATAWFTARSWTRHRSAA